MASGIPETFRVMLIAPLFDGHLATPVHFTAAQLRRRLKQQIVYKLAICVQKQLHRDCIFSGKAQELIAKTATSG